MSLFSRACSHKGIDNESKVDKSQKDNIKSIIAGKNTAKSFETAKEPLDLITLFVQLLIIAPRIFAIAFWQNDRYIAPVPKPASRPFHRPSPSEDRPDGQPGQAAAEGHSP